MLAIKEEDNKNDEDDEQESVHNQTKYWLIEDNPKSGPKLNKQFLRCTQTANLRSNFLFWDAKSSSSSS